jgi:hypothetical protein
MCGIGCVLRVDTWKVSDEQDTEIIFSGKPGIYNKK